MVCVKLAVPIRSESDVVATPNSLRIGLTGGIASGKSTVANFFADLGVAIIDTDLIARQVVEPGQPALAEIRAAFGDAVFGADGRLDRKALRAIVFADDDKRRQLESILHPRIRKATARQAERAAGPYHIVVVPLLAESPMRSEMDRILVVDCAPEVQLDRLRRRDGESESRARKIIASQASRAERLEIADDVILNEGDLDETRRQVEALHRRYLSLSADTAGAAGD